MTDLSTTLEGDHDFNDQEIVTLPVPSDAPQVQIEYVNTDVGNAKRLIQEYGDEFRYCEENQSWYLWDGQRWKKSDIGRITHLAIKTVEKMLENLPPDDDERKNNKRKAFALKSQEISRINAMVKIAQSMHTVGADELDSYINLFNCRNKTLNFDSFQDHGNRREDYLTQLANVNIDTDAECPNWLAHLNIVFNDNREEIEFFQRLCGYFLLGTNQEQKFIILWGGGANGKSAILEVLAHIMGDYFRNAEATTFLLQKGHKVREDIIRLKGARLVVAQETNQDVRLDESLIKQLTGGDIVTARDLYKGSEEFRSRACFILATNNKPEIRGSDNGIWRRILLIPFLNSIPEDQRIGQFAQKYLIPEADGIFRWMLHGLAQYRFSEDGLKVPPKYKDAVKSYRSEGDILHDFLEDECILGPSQKVMIKDIHERYLQWCDDNGEEPIKSRTFTKRLQERIGDKICKGKVERARGLLGIGLKPLSNQDRDQILVPVRNMRAGEISGYF